jgi:biopolymer transport protein ExbB
MRTLATTLPIDMIADAGSLRRDSSPLLMFLGASGLVKLVLLTLVIAAAATWWMWASRALRIRMARRRAGTAVDALSRAGGVAEAAKQARGKFGPVPAMIMAAQDELLQSAGARNDRIEERISWQLERLEAAAGERMERGLGFIIVVAVTAPLLGLLGTVWSLINGFASIAQTNSPSLAPVAHTIAEALFATALGLLAAIPAAAMHILLARSIGRYRKLLTDASAAVMRLVSHELDRPQATNPQAAE